MADEARLTIVIEEPAGATSAGAAARPADDMPGWYPRYRELRNRADAGRIPLDALEREELDDLSRKLTEYVSGAPAAPPSPLPAATGEAVGRVAPAPAAASDYQAADPEIEPPTQEELDDLRAMFGMMGGATPPPSTATPGVTYRPPSPAPPGWAVPPPVGIYQPPPPPPPPGSQGADPGEPEGPGFPGWEKAYREAAVGSGRFGDPKAFADDPEAGRVSPATAAMGEYVAGQRQRHTDRLNREFREEIEAGEAGRTENAAAFDAATGSMSGGKKALFGAAVGAAQASAAGESVMGGAATGAMAAAGGPVGLAVAAVGLAEEIKKKIAQAPIDGINALADAAKMAAGNDGMGLFKKGAEAATGALEKIPVVGETIALPFKTAAAAVTAFADVADVFVARGRALSGYSGELAGSAARADVAGLTADIREAQVLGPDTARLMDAMTDLNQMVREGLLPIKKVIVEILADALKEVRETARALLTVLAEPSALVPDGVEEWAKKVLAALTDTGAPDTLIQDWLGAADDLGPMSAIPGGGAPAPAGFGRAGPGGLDLPVFSR